MNAIIRTSGLTKRYGRVHALDGLDLRVDEGQVHGFLGPNGAGKSTTIRILLGLARRTGGEAEVFGEDPWTTAVRIHRRLASVPGDVSIWPNLSGGESIDLLARLRGAGTRHDRYRDERARLEEAFQFDPRKKGRAYSKGNRQKVALIAAFAVPADLYVLDEPTSGLDPLMEVMFRREVARVKATGATVLLSSHIMSEVEQLCDRVSIIREGRIVETGTLAELRHLTRTEVSFAATDAAALDGIPDAHEGRIEEGRARFTIDSDRVSAVLPALAERHVAGLRIEPPSLEELFLRHYGDDLAAFEGAGTAGPTAPSSTPSSTPPTGTPPAGPGTRAGRRGRAKAGR
ncbi:ABC-2 type transport system ATP-binding protein [Microbacterium resistens]|uniref:ABC-2 type transport system ATP-binding protein n=1 Tax=Microbacterium resistens TaxID=156977 RepID=A0ABU1SAY0_9MICO|nr:ABC transporter ATP-binding protein [Microbacterium resistens]MDR6866776.1 ABC-2 type transport system ATP-binding protein [Microbacterium resistens]